MVLMSCISRLFQPKKWELQGAITYTIYIGWHSNLALYLVTINQSLYNML